MTSQSTDHLSVQDRDRDNNAYPSDSIQYIPLQPQKTRNSSSIETKSEIKIKNQKIRIDLMQSTAGLAIVDLTPLLRDLLSSRFACLTIRAAFLLLSDTISYENLTLVFFMDKLIH